MKIDFEAIQETLVDGLRGGKGLVGIRAHADAHNRLLMGRLVPGASIGGHRHVGDSETIYILKGQGTMHGETGDYALCAGQVSYCSPGAWHSLENTGEEDLHFFAIIPQHATI